VPTRITLIPRGLLLAIYVDRDEGAGGWRVYAGREDDGLRAGVTP
jgi:hypothetical protein